MRKILLTAAAAAATCLMTPTQAQTTQASSNPFFSEFTASPHGTPPFDKISLEDYMPAVERGIALGRANVDRIVNNPEAPTFANTIAALEDINLDLDRVLGVFYPLEDALSNDTVMELANKIAPMVTAYNTSVNLNEGLWRRVRAVHDSADTTALTQEQKMLLRQTYDSFVRNGALLEGADREKYSQLKSRLSELTNTFGQNVLRELNTYQIWLTADELAGLTEGTIEAAALAAKEAGRPGEYLFTLAQPVYTAFMKNSSRRDLREKMYRLYSSRNTKGQYSNLEVMKEIAATRLAIANLLGYKTYADYALADKMAKNPEGVYTLLNSLRDAYRPAQQRELKEIADYAAELEGHPIDLKPWDYSYYSNKLRNARYSYDEEEMRPYFPLASVVDGVFGLATKLYGVTFEKNTDIPVYHPDVTAYDVRDADGSYLGVIYTDFFPRASKRAGAWMTDFKGQRILPDGTNSRPHVTIVMNFTKPTDTKPSLLTPYEVETFLHEFGHALHGLLANSTYQSLSGTNVKRDFVELPSQFNENYLTEKEFLDGFARHYLTGEPIPAELVDRLIASSQFGAAYACMRQLNFGLLDMAWHTITAPVDDPVAFERQATESVAIFEPVEGTLVAPTFSHIFAGGYAAGYYGYKWAEVLDADAFAHFKEHGIFDPETARSFRDNILSRGGTEDPDVLYRRFRGHDATIDALLRRDGITPTITLPTPAVRKD